MTELTAGLNMIAEKIRRNFTMSDQAREQALPVSREAIRFCSLSIRAVHRRQFDEAARMHLSAKNLLEEAETAIAASGELANTAFFRDAQKEYAEARSFAALVNGQPLLGPDELGVDYAAYLNGLGEAVGELRRYLLDNLRRGELAGGEDLLRAMDDIYEVLVTMDFPDAITGGLRRTTDMVRGVLERTRSDLTLTIQQKSLENRLEDFQARA